MTHKHQSTGKEFEIGTLKDLDGVHTYDITVVTKWTDPESDELPPVRFINYYFGEYDKDDTDFYIDKFIEQQQQLLKAIKHLENLRQINSKFMSLDEIYDLNMTIESMYQMIDNDLI